MASKQKEKAMPQQAKVTPMVWYEIHVTKQYEEVYRVKAKDYVHSNGKTERDFNLNDVITMSSTKDNPKTVGLFMVEKEEAYRGSANESEEV